MRALLLVDIQNDFLPGGALAVKNGDEIIPVVNQLLDMPFDVIVATKDWHPANHKSFASNNPGKQVGDLITLDGVEQILWPIHCVQNTKGAEFPKTWDAEKVDQIFYKGVDERIDSYSCFYDNDHRRATGLGDYLRQKRVTDIYIAGLATDYCVKFSALDALKLGFRVFVVFDACRGIDLVPGEVKKALEEIERAGGQLISSEAIL